VRPNSGINNHRDKEASRRLILQKVNENFYRKLFFQDLKAFSINHQNAIADMKRVSLSFCISVSHTHFLVWIDR
jgi:hypothetical protein